MNRLELGVLPGEYAINRLPSGAFDWISGSLLLEQATFYSVTNTPEELSVVCDDTIAFPNALSVDTGWRALKVQGPLEFSLVGVLNSLTAPLAEARISIFAVSTFDTDYLLVKKEAWEQALNVLKQHHDISGQDLVEPAAL